MLFCNEAASTEIYMYGHTLSRHGALPSFDGKGLYRLTIFDGPSRDADAEAYLRRLFGGDFPHEIIDVTYWERRDFVAERRSEEHTSELQSLMRNSYAVFCLKKKIKTKMTDR